VGVQHFVDSFGRAAFYGLVDGATVDSLLLRAVSDTIAGESFLPLVRPVFRVRSAAGAGDGADAAQQEDEGNVAAAGAAEMDGAIPGRQRLGLQRQYIRRINFQLLQV
jgi:hypothetical protein